MAVTLNLPILPCESPEGSLDARVLCSPKARVTLSYPRGSVITMKGCERHEMVCRFLFGAAVDCGAVDCGLVSSRLPVLCGAPSRLYGVEVVAKPF